MPSHQDDQIPPDRAGDRIAKLLARAGVASRRDIERMIADGRIAKDGVVLDTPATVLKSLAGITVDGEPVGAPEHARLFLYHKPPGLLVTERDPKGRPTIYDRLPADLPRVVPVGRLDLATEGLLMLTTDGGFKRQLELPATGVERSYRARAYGNVTQAQLEDLADGVEIEGIRYGSIDANIERRTGANVWIELTLTEGKNREVRRVLEYLGLQVSRLIRTRYGPFVLADLPPGEVGEIKQHDLVAFRKTLESPRRQREQMEPVSVEGPARNAGASGRPRSHLPSQRQEGDVPYRGERVPRPVSARGSRGAARHPADERAPAGRPAPAERSERPSFRTGDDRPMRSEAQQGQRRTPDRAAPAPRGDAPRPGFRPQADRMARPGTTRPSRTATDPRAARSDADARPPRAAAPDRTGWAKAAPRPNKGRPDRSATPRPPRAGDDRPERAPAPRGERMDAVRGERTDASRGARTGATLSPRTKGPAGGRGRPPRDGDNPRTGPGKGPAGGRGHPPKAKR